MHNNPESVSTEGYLSIYGGLQKVPNLDYQKVVKIAKKIISLFFVLLLLLFSFDSRISKTILN